MKWKLLIILCVQLCCDALVCAADYSLIDNLPGKLAAAKIEGHKGWDTGNTDNMIDATYKYNDALADLLKNLSAAYHTSDPKAADVGDYVKSLYALHRAKQEKEGPSGQFRGSMPELDVPADVSDDLEKKIADLVQKITAGDSKFNYKEWKQKWDKAGRTGD